MSCAPPDFRAPIDPGSPEEAALAAARYDLDTERKASACLADRCLDLGRELEALRAAVRAHEADARASGHAVPQRDLDLWAAAKT